MGVTTRTIVDRDCMIKIYGGMEVLAFEFAQRVSKAGLGASIIEAIF